MFSSGTRFARSLTGILALAGLWTVSAGCRSAPDTTGSRRLFVAPLANVTSDAGLDWFGRALSIVVVARTAGIPDVQTQASFEPRTTHRLEGYFSESGGALHVRAFLRNLATQKIVETLDLRGPASDVLKMSEQLATRFAGGVKPYGTADVQAVRMLMEAASHSSRDDVLKYIDASLAADPSFGSAHLARVQYFLAVNRRDDASLAIQNASRPSVRFTDEEKLKLSELRAAITGNSIERARAARALAEFRGDDLQLWRTAGELALVAKDFPSAINAYKKCVGIEPDNIVSWNTLGYAQAYAGDLASARKALDEYRRIAPDDANALDSLGEVHYYLGRFEEAEKYFLEAFEKNKTQLGGGEALRAAMSRLLMGDRATADKHAAKYFEVRRSAKDPFLPVREGMWQFATGRRPEAMSALEKIVAPPEAAAAANLLLTLWHLQFGDLARAQAFAIAATKFAQSTPAAVGSALMARFAASPPAAASPTLAAQLDPTRRQLLGYSLLLHRRYADAAPLWRQLYDSTSAVTAQEERVLLYWAEAERGNTAEAASLMRGYALPPSGLEPNLSSVLFPRSIFLKAIAEQHAKNNKQAVRLFKLFLEYSGNRDFIYGEEKRAREALR